MQTKKIVSVGLGQINPTVGDIGGNTRKIISYIDQAKRARLNLLVFPELAISGYPIWDLANKPQFVSLQLKALSDITKATIGSQLTVAVGFIDQSVKKNGKSHNAIAILRNGKVVHRQYKTLLPTYDVFLERIFFDPAESHHVFKLNGLSIGSSICEDIWDDQYPVKPMKIYAQMGAELIINISASPFHRTVAKKRADLISRKARENRVWIIYVNQVGGQDDLIFDGRSVVCDPHGKVVFEAKPFEEGLFRFDINFGTKSMPSRKLLRNAPNAAEIYEALKLGLSDYVRKNGFKRVVLGLSGGIDSSLVAALAKDALGAEAVIGVAMPGPFSSEGSLLDAKLLAHNLGIEFRTKKIGSLYEKFISESCEEKSSRGVCPSETGQISLAMENLQARLRGLQLMYLSNDESALLLTTGNKSELAVGYGTLYGDMCGGLAVIGDVYKTDVYRLVAYRNTISPVIPKAVIEKAPSAELRPNQKDSDSLPDYDVLDQILNFYIEENLGFHEICKKLGTRIRPEVVRKTIEKVDFNEYKRRQLPPSLRISEKAWFGRRMPITNKFRPAVDA